MCSEQGGGSGVDEHLRGALAESDGIGSAARSSVMDANGCAGIRCGDYAKDFYFSVTSCNRAAMDANRNLAASA
jgi:hypothetical protein